MTPERILRASLCRPPSCGPYDRSSRESEIENMLFSDEYAEPGYGDAGKGILFANWNMFCREAVDLLGELGYQIEWSDEWTCCSECGKALRISPDSYRWQPSYFLVNECEELCIECVDMEEYLESLEGNPRRALNDHINPADYGYVKLEGDFESGLHPGQNSNPKMIFERLKAAGHKRLLFNIDEASQFYITFSIWEKKQEEEA
jgi:hypothetical protein